MHNVSLEVLNARDNNYINHDCNKILNSDWLSTVLSSALTGQYTPSRRLKWLFFTSSQKKKLSEFLGF